MGTVTSISKAKGIECLVRYYFRTTEKERVVCFERRARFADVPPVGAELHLDVDCLTVTRIIFREHAEPPMLIVEDFIVGKAGVSWEDEIAGMKDQGWQVASDYKKGRKR